MASKPAEIITRETVDYFSSVLGHLFYFLWLSKPSAVVENILKEDGKRDETFTYLFKEVDMYFNSQLLKILPLSLGHLPKVRSHFPGKSIGNFFCFLFWTKDNAVSFNALLSLPILHSSIFVNCFTLLLLSFVKCY